MRHGLDLAHDLGERRRDDVRRVERHHRAKLTLAHEVDGLARRSASPACGRSSWARRPRCRWPSTTDRVSLPVSVPSASADLCADAAEPLDVPVVRLLERAPASRPLGNAPSATTTMLKCAPQLIAFAQPIGDERQVERNFRNQDRVGAAGHAGVERNPAGVAPHHLDDDDAPVRFGRRVQAIDRVGGKRHRRVETEAVRRADDVVVDGFRDADDRDAAIRRTGGRWPACRRRRSRRARRAPSCGTSRRSGPSRSASLRRSRSSWRTGCRGSRCRGSCRRAA